MKQKFISEPIKPAVATADTDMMATGGPGLPKEFTWRGKVLGIDSLLNSREETGPCRHGSREVYVRKHWFEVITSTGLRATIYFERQPRGGKLTKRWWLFSIESQP